MRSNFEITRSMEIPKLVVRGNVKLSERKESLTDTCKIWFVLMSLLL